MGRKSQRKGRDGEREFLQLLQMRGIEAQRNNQKFVGGRGNPDVGAQIGEYKYHFEVKRTEKFRLYDALDQAQRDAETESIPVVVHRSNCHPWAVVMTLEDFLQIVGIERPWNEPTAEEAAELDEMMEAWSREADVLIQNFDLTI